MAKLKGKLGCTLNLTIRYCTSSTQPDMSKIDRKLWVSDVVTPQSCPRKWGKWTKRICEETSFLFWFFLKLGRRAHHDRFFPTFGITHLKSVFRLKHIPASDVKKAIQRLPNKMSTGSDLISYRLLKAAGPGIVGPLTTLFNLSLKRHEVPNEWKHSVVCPIFKGGRKDRRVPTKL